MGHCLARAAQGYGPANAPSRSKGGSCWNEWHKCTSPVQLIDATQVSRLRVFGGGQHWQNKSTTGLVVHLARVHATSVGGGGADVCLNFVAVCGAAVAVVALNHGDHLTAPPPPPPHHSNV